MTNEELARKAAQIRLDTLVSTHKAGVGNIGACMSIIEILTTVYYGEIYSKKLLNFDVKNPGKENQDYFILSKVNAIAANYAVLADLGYFDKSELDFFAKEGALLQENPSNKIPGIYANLESGEQGLSVALGLALSLKQERKNNKVYCLIDYADLQKGDIYEALHFAANYKLDNLIVFVDYPKTEFEVSVEKLAKVDKIQDKFEAFSWKVLQVTDAHNYDQLFEAILKAHATIRKPICIWAHTVAGKGIDFAEMKRGYINTVLSEGELTHILPKFKQLI